MTYIVLKKIVISHNGNKLILKSQQRFKRERHKVFIGEINKITSNSIETHAYGLSKDLLSKKDDIKCSNVIKQYKKQKH